MLSSARTREAKREREFALGALGCTVQSLF